MYELHELHYKEYFEQFILYSYTPEDELTSNDYLERVKDGVVRKKASRCMHLEKVARIQTVSMQSGELFYLCTLLLY